jgi:nicotinamidase-related amidase
MIDMQRLTCDPEFGLARRRSGLVTDAAVARYYQNVRSAAANGARLIAACRNAKIRVVHTHLASATADGRDVTDLMRQHGLWTAKGSPESAFLDALAPVHDDLVLARTTFSFFTSWLGDQLLHNLGVSTLILAGVLTDSSVASTARDAGDRGYRTIVAADACAALTAEDHDGSLELLDLWYGRVADTEAVLRAIDGVEEFAETAAKG